MKTCVFLVCFLSAMAIAVHGRMRDQVLEMFDQDARATLEEIQDEPESHLAVENPIIQEDGNESKPSIPEHGCNCNSECRELSHNRLPPDVRVKDNYLSYENFPVLCRDAASIRLPAGEKYAKKYVCKEVFDCCRKCNHYFYVCLNAPVAHTYGFCLRSAYKCMCNCIENKSYGELSYKPL